MQGLQTPNADPKQKDGALCMVRTILILIISCNIYTMNKRTVIIIYLFKIFITFLIVCLQRYFLSQFMNDVADWCDSRYSFQKRII